MPFWLGAVVSVRFGSVRFAVFVKARFGASVRCIGSVSVPGRFLVVCGFGSVRCLEDPGLIASENKSNTDCLPQEVYSSGLSVLGSS